uniref:F-box domain-containing protein n=1 Tax=Arundo donax TaxID=35708 RepID=A0A0A9F434_ARUDO
MENGLPDDPLVEILSRLPAKSLGRFKCVSKPCRDLIADRLRCRKFPQTLQGFVYGDGETHAGENYGHFINPLGASVPLIDPSFTFLTKLPGIEMIVLLGSCNGLVLFGHRRASDIYDSLGYIVCNPAT